MSSNTYNDTYKSKHNYRHTNIYYMNEIGGRYLEREEDLQNLKKKPWVMKKNDNHQLTMGLKKEKQLQQQLFDCYVHSVPDVPFCQKNLLPLFICTKM